MITKKIKDSFRFTKKIFSFTSLSLKKTKRKSIIICHDSISTIPCYISNKLFKNPVILDITETPNLKKRTTSYYTTLSPYLIKFLEAIEKNTAKISVLITTSSNPYKTLLEKRYNKKVNLIINYKIIDEITGDTRNLDKNSSDIWIAWPSDFNEKTGANLALKALSLLPSNWKLIIIGSLTKDYKKKLASNNLYLEGRIISLPYQEEENYKSIIKMCNIGWVLFDNKNQNLNMCLPNRFLDLLSNGVPIISTKNQSIDEILNFEKWGCCVLENDIDSLVNQSIYFSNITIVAPTENKLNRILKARSLTDTIDQLSYFQHPCTVTIITMRDLCRRKRILNMTEELVKKGHEVNIVCIRGKSLILNSALYAEYKNKISIYSLREL